MVLLSGLRSRVPVKYQLLVTVGDAQFKSCFNLISRTLKFNMNCQTIEECGVIIRYPVAN